MNVVLNFKDNLAGLRPAASRPSSRNRFFQIEDEGWYLHAREGVQGPFASLQEAEAFLDRLTGGRNGRTSRP